MKVIIYENLQFYIDLFCFFIIVQKNCYNLPKFLRNCIIYAIMFQKKSIKKKVFHQTIWIEFPSTIATWCQGCWNIV